MKTAMTNHHVAPRAARPGETANPVPHSRKRRTAGQHAICRLLLAAGTVLVSASATAGEPDEIVTDRPDFVESSNVVGKGKIQIETSLAVERDNANGKRERTTTTPTLIRLGVTETLELRVETDGRTVARSTNHASGASVTERGMADSAIGAKWHLADANGILPSVGLLAHLDLPSGADAFRGDGVRPSLRLVGEWDLPHEMSLGLMPGIVMDKDAEGRRYTGGIFGLVVGKSWTGRFRTFAEIAMPRIATTEHGGVQAAVDIGAAYLVNRQVQIDAALARGLNKNTPDLGWTVGLSVKF